MALVHLLKVAYIGWKGHHVSKLAASLAYYAILSLAPLVIVVIAIVGLLFNAHAAREGLLAQIQALVGTEGRELIETMITRAQRPGGGAVATIIGLITLLWGASGVFTELRDSLNTIWEVKSANGQGMWSALREQYLSFGMVFGVGFLLLVSLFLNAALATLSHYFYQSLPIQTFILDALNFLVTVLVITLLFAAIYRFLPSERLPWSDLWIGSLGTSIFFILGKSIVGAYLGRASVGSAYGAAGSLIVLLVWIYYAAQLFFFGAEFTHAYAATHGSVKNRGKDVTENPQRVHVNSESLYPSLPPPAVQSGVTIVLPSDASRVKRGRGATMGALLYLTAIAGIGWWRLRGTKSPPQPR
ncbi:MAG: YihY/virulence factor BrkB family protein [Acidobacteriota bacterium]|nr:YihY/virulence factor BrkB family protein [Acidobacteriota bacterium]